MSGVRDELSVEATDAHGAKRTVPRNIADHQRGGRADDAENVRFIFAVGAEDDGLDLNFVIPTFRKQRTNRTIGETAGENFFFSRTTFALEVTARKFSRRSRLLAVIHGERKEVLAFLGLDRRDGGDEDDGFAELDGYGAVAAVKRSEEHTSELQ